MVLQFEAGTHAEMLVACLWDHWHGKDGTELYSFVAITDEPRGEIAASGHQRCVAALKDRSLQEWLVPQELSPARPDAVLDEKETPYYEHRIAA